VRRTKGGVMSSVKFELYLTADPETMLASARRLSPSNPSYGLYDEMVSLSKRELVGKIREASSLQTEASTTPKKSSTKDTTIAFFGHQRALRGGAPRDIAVVLGNEDSQRTARSAHYTTRALLAQSEPDEFHPDLQVYVQRDPEKRNGKYSLDFKGRGKVASVKNFQLCRVHAKANKKDETVLQFCKVSANRFNLDFAPPFTPLSAFALAVSTCLT